MGGVGDLAKAQRADQPAQADHQPDQHHADHSGRQTEMPIGRQPLEQPAVAEQTVEHTGQAAEDRRPAEHELRQVGHKAEQQGQRQQHQTALTPFDAPAQLPEPQAVHRQVQHAEVHQHRAERPPPLAGGQAVGQRQEVGVVALDAEIGEGQPADQLQVVAEPTAQRDGEGRQ
ncbi:hypothetical protein D3C86_1725130 [compost metagenome]